MTSGPRRRLPPEERRAQLIALGMDLLSERSIDEVSVDEIADAAGISKGLLFHYFESKREFQLAVVGHAAADLLARTAPDPGLPPLERLIRGIEQYVDYVAENASAYVRLVSGGSHADPELDALFDQTRQTNANRLVDALIELGANDSTLLRVSARAWVAFVEEATVTALVRSELPRDELVAFLQRASIPVISVAVDDPDGVQRVLQG